ncbi:MAG: DUF2812 domain-containing protein [Angelakisella sp.]
MKDTVKKLINFRVDCYEDIEVKLEKLAAQGLLLKECGSFLWTFRKTAPQKLKYTVTFFSEGSVFNPGITDNQQTYFDYAKSAGWNFVTGLNQMQIFCSEANNPIPFETDEKEKLENIKKCMNKSFIPSIIVLILIFAFNLLAQFNSFRHNPIDFLSDPSRLFPAFIIVALVIYEVYSLLHYLFWYKRSEKSVANGGDCVNRRSTTAKAVDIIFNVVIFVSIGYFFIVLARRVSWFGLLLSFAQVPILMLLFWSSIQYLKKKKASATLNKVISITLLIIADFSGLAVIMMIILRFGFTTDDASTYRTVAWPISATYNHEYKLYSDEIPLTCEDLYGETDYEYYSYEHDSNSSFFLIKSEYRQDSLPAKDAPPRIEYEILEPQFDFVYRLSKEHLLEIPEWQNNTSLERIDNRIFDTAEAYQHYYEGTPTGEYILFFESKIVVLNMEEPLNVKQISIIKEKLDI